MNPGFLVICHGSRDTSWVALVDEAVRQAEFPEGVPVEVVFLEIVEGRLIQDGIDRLEAKGVTDLLVIPFFVSGGSTHLDEIAYALGVKAMPAIETDLVPFRARANVYFGQPMDSDPEELARIILEKHHENRSQEESKDAEVLLLIGHGSDHPVFYERWVQGIQRIADEVRKQGKFVEVDTALLLPDQMYGKIIRWQNETDLTIRVVPLFLSSGYFTNHVIPKRIGQAACEYNGQALLPHPLISRWLERQAWTALQCVRNHME